jgi:hypothetical protein
VVLDALTLSPPTEYLGRRCNVRIDRIVLGLFSRLVPVGMGGVDLLLATLEIPEAAKEEL